jgi:hypothetical protein
MVRVYRRLTLLAWACLAFLIPLPAVADETCIAWSLLGGFAAIQDNEARVLVTDPHEPVQGAGRWSGTGQVIDKDGHKTGEGLVGLYVKGNSIEMTTEWGGVYLGTIDQTGRIDGTTYDKKDSTSSSTWYSDRRLSCSAYGRPSGTSPPAHPAAPPAHAAAPPAPLRPMSHPHATAGQSCASGYVWRAAVPSDLVCVLPGSRDTVADENAQAASHRQPGSDVCVSGYVWREAFDGDRVCVPTDRRDAVEQENQEASQHLAR